MTASGSVRAPTPFTAAASAAAAAAAASASSASAASASAARSAATTSRPVLADVVERKQVVAVAPAHAVIDVARRLVFAFGKYGEQLAGSQVTLNVDSKPDSVVIRLYNGALYQFVIDPSQFAELCFDRDPKVHTYTVEELIGGHMGSVKCEFPDAENARNKAKNTSTITALAAVEATRRDLYFTLNNRAGCCGSSTERYTLRLGLVGNVPGSVELVRERRSWLFWWKQDLSLTVPALAQLALAQTAPAVR